MVALVAQYDSVLAEVISLPYRSTKYLSHDIQKEIINLLGNAVRSSLVTKINRAPFWSIILDTTSRRGGGGGEGVLILRATSVLKLQGATSV